MARTVSEIKKEMTTAFMYDATVAAQYEFTLGADFDATFSKVSIENILFFIVACANWTLENLFDKHKEELTTLIDTKKPHRLKWYRDKTLAFQYGRSLDIDSDVYAEVVESEKIVKYASVTEYQGRLYIKVAKGETTKEVLSNAEQTALENYLNEIRDAGVRIGDVPNKVTVTNQPADHFNLTMDVYYDPLVFGADGLQLANGADKVRDTIKDFVENRIPFNGEYRNSLLVDTLQALNGVIIPELILAKTISHANFIATTGTVTWETIRAKHLPVSGYYKVYDEADLQLNFIAYQTITSV